MSHPDRKSLYGHYYVYGRAIRALRSMTNTYRKQGTEVAAPGAELTTGYHPRSY